MANHAANGLSFFMSIKADQLHQLAAIRHWDNLKLAMDDDLVWIKDLTYAQVCTTEVGVLLTKTLYYAINGKLCLKGSVLPERNIPSLLWTPIERALQVSLPPFNHNYFGLREQISVHILPSEQEQKTTAMLTDLETLGRYIVTAPEIRLVNIRWTILNTRKVFLTGTPLLPISGATYWQRRDCFLPAGYDLDLHLLLKQLNKMLDPEGQKLVLWHTDSTYTLIDRQDMRPLSLASFRKSTQPLSLT